MKIIFFSSNIDIIEEWKQRHKIENSIICYDIDSLSNKLKNNKNVILIADYDSVSSEMNTFISSGNTVENLIVLEKSPAIVTGKMLILRGTKAYGNSRMLTNHFTQMVTTVQDGNIWTYPELTAELSKISDEVALSSNSSELVNSRLSSKETEVLYLILKGFTNNAIAIELEVTERTVKAHVSSIFSKLHVNDRVSLILLLK